MAESENCYKQESHISFKDTIS